MILFTETNDGEYTFAQESSYIKEYPKQFLTFSMPVTGKVYKDKRLFPFFEGLIPEAGFWILPLITGKSIKRSDGLTFSLL